MAVNELAPAPAGKDAPPAAAKPAGSAAKPGAGLDALAPWLGMIFVGSLLLVYCGERIVPTYAWARYGLSGLGVLGAVVATLLRFAGAGAKSAERRRVERALAIFGAIGLLGLLVYFATTDTGKSLLGIAAAAPDKRARIEGALTVGWIVLVLGSVLPMLFGERALAPMRHAAQMELRRVRAATTAGLVLTFAAIYATLFTYAAGELDKKVDFSYFRTARPSESTRKIAANLSDPLKVMAFFPQLNDVGIEVESYLRDLAQSAPQLQIETYDRLLVPAVAKETKVTQDGVIVLMRATKREMVVVGADMNTAKTKLKSLDGDFQKALLKAMRDQRTAYFTIGHGEINEGAGPAAAKGRSGKGFRKLLELQNYSVRDLGLSQGLGQEIPKDAYLVVIFGPSQPFLPEEIAALRAYADRGGKLFMALDPSPGSSLAEAAPNALDTKVDLSLLADIVDLTWQPTVLAAADRNFILRRRNDADRLNLFTDRFSSHASVSTLSRLSPRAKVIVSGAAALDKKSDTTTAIDFAIRSMSDAFADLDGNFKLDQPAEKKATMNLAAAVTKPAAGGGDKPEEMRAFVITDADGLSDGWLGWEPNQLLIVDVLRWLGGEESFAGEITTAEDVRIEHTKEKDVLWFYATIFAAPALVLGIGFITTRRTRRSGGRRA